MNWEKWFDEHGDDALMVHDWPENGPGAQDVEEMYQAFKSRLLSELRGTSEEMKDGQRVSVRLAGDEAWYVGTVIKARKMWVKLDDYGREMIADESNIEQWRESTGPGDLNG